MPYSKYPPTYKYTPFIKMNLPGCFAHIIAQSSTLLHLSFKYNSMKLANSWGFNSTSFKWKIQWNLTLWCINLSLISSWCPQTLAATLFVQHLVQAKTKPFCDRNPFRVFTAINDDLLSAGPLKYIWGEIYQMNMPISSLTHLLLAPHIFVSDLGQHWFK